MRKLIATVFNYSPDGLLADEFRKFCFDLPETREPSTAATANEPHVSRRL